MNVCIHEAVLNDSVYTEGRGLPGLNFHPLMISTCEESGVGGLRGYRSHSEVGKEGGGHTSQAVR